MIASILLGSAGLAKATGLFYYGLEDGQVRAMDILTGGDSGISIPASAFVGNPPSSATGRNIAFDPHTDLLWYSADDNHVHSVVVSTLAAGPTISDINDASLGASRTIAIDRNARRLYISNSNGNVEVYELITNTGMYTIPLSAFGYSEPNPGNRRHLAADADSFLWYAAADGTLKEFDPIAHDPHFTGREISVDEQIDTGSPGQERCFVAVRWPAGQHYLYYASSDGTIRTADLETLNNVTITYPESWFWTTSHPGALRSLAIDPTWTPSGDPPSMPTGIVASDGTFLDRVRLGWNAVPGGAGYPLTVYPPDGSFPYSIWVDGTAYDHMDALPVDSHWEYSVSACVDPSSCSGDTPSVWGWIGTFIFVDGFESGDLSGWSNVTQ